MKYRLLQEGESVMPGDEWANWGHEDWTVCGTPTGRTQGVNPVGFQYRRPVPDDNWIAFSDRKPTKEDGFNGAALGNLDGIRPGVILVYHDDGTCGLFMWDALSNWSLGDGGHTHWMPLNFVPREPARIKVDGHEVIPNKDGSLKVGCQTVSSQDFEEIVRQRKEAMQ